MVLPRRGTLAVGVVCALVAWAVNGADGLLAASIGALLVVAFFASGQVPMFLAGQVALEARAGVALLITTYLLRLVLVFAVLALAADSDRVDGPTLGVTLIVCTVAWSVLMLAAVLRARRST
jgi:hypothetical protein